MPALTGACRPPRRTPQGDRVKTIDHLPTDGIEVRTFDAGSVRRRMVTEKQRMIACAKRKAKRIAKSERKTHQQALDTLARERGRKHWSAFIADPIHVDRDVLGVCISADAIVDMHACTLVAEIVHPDRPDDDPIATYVLFHDLDAHTAQEACDMFHHEPATIVDVDKLLADADVDASCHVRIMWTNRTAEYLSCCYHSLDILREIPSARTVRQEAWRVFCHSLVQNPT